MHNNTFKPLIATLYNVIFAIDLWNWIFSIITLMNLAHNWMHTLLYNFLQGGGYSPQIASHQSELSREDCFDQTSLSLSALQIDYPNLDNSVQVIERANFDHSKLSHCGGSHPTKRYFKQHRKRKANNKSSSYFN